MAESNSLPAPVHLASIDRPAVRALVEADARYFLSVASTGGNVYQMSLDRQDEIKIFAANLSAEESQRFWELYGEELTASSNAANAEAARIQMQGAQDERNIATWISIIAFFAVLIAVIKIFRG